jgi:hypothetical protein
MTTTTDELSGDTSLIGNDDNDTVPTTPRFSDYPHSKANAQQLLAKLHSTSPSLLKFYVVASASHQDQA